jgi:DNA-binding NtrC family response regulator
MDCKECKAIASDFKIPNINGFQLARSVTELRPDIKVVLMSAFEVSMSEFKAVFPSTHVDTVLKKPFLPSRLAEMIRQFLPMEKVT